MTPREDGLLGHAKNRKHGKWRDNPAFQDMAVAAATDEKIMKKPRQPLSCVFLL